MDQPDFIVLDFMEYFIGLKRVKRKNKRIRFQNSLYIGQSLYDFGQNFEIEY